MQAPEPESSQPPAEDLTERLVTRFGEVMPHYLMATRRRFMATAFPEGLTWPQVTVLRFIAECETTPSELARNFLMPGPSVTSLIDGLVEKGFVERHPDARDRRIIRLRLSSTGDRVQAACRAVMREVVRSALTRLPPDRQRRLLEALDDLEFLTQHDHEGERPHGCSVRSSTGISPRAGI